jgi:alpha/beta superfamily hydrolase
LPRRIESHFLPGPAGRLEALLEEPEEDEPQGAALVCHPHPLHGGTMHNKVVHRLARGLRRAGHVVLRFNFRGVNLSHGLHARGVGEVEDARAALDWLRERYPELPYCLAGFSFGARVILSLGCGSPGARRLIAAGFPTRHGDTAYLASCGTPKLFIQSTHDEHGPREELEAAVAKAAEPKTIVWVPAADHFFRGALDQFEEEVFRAGS